MADQSEPQTQPPAPTAPTGPPILTSVLSVQWSPVHVLPLGQEIWIETYKGREVALTVRRIRGEGAEAIAEYHEAGENADPRLLESYVWDLLQKLNQRRLRAAMEGSLSLMLGISGIPTGTLGPEHGSLLEGCGGVRWHGRHLPEALDIRLAIVDHKIYRDLKAAGAVE